MDGSGEVIAGFAVKMGMIISLAYVLFHEWRNEKNDTVVAFAVFVACFNLYTIGLITKDLSDSIEQFCWLVFAVYECSAIKGYHYLLLGVSASFNPSNALFALVSLKMVSNQQTKTISFATGALLCLIYLLLTRGISLIHYIQLYFPASFEPQFNLLWMLYAHMFDRYLTLYQIVFLVLQISSVYLIGTLNFSPRFKLVLLTYFKVYCTYKCSQLCLVLALILSIGLMYRQITLLIEDCNALGEEKEMIKVKTLTLIIVIANIVFFPLDKILLGKYLNDFSLNIGYLFLFFGFPWIMNSIYLAEIAITINEIKLKAKIIEKVSEESVKEVSQMEAQN